MNAMVATAARRPLLASVRDLVRFDLLRFRAIAVAVVALEVCRSAFVEWSVRFQPVAIGTIFSGTFGAEMMLFDAVLLLTTVVATVMIVQADLPSDDRAFWRSHPIPPLVVALAKMTTLSLLFVVVPSVINTGRLAAAGAPLSAMIAATVQIAVLAGSIVTPAWALAIATGTLPIFQITAAILLALGFLLSGALFYWESLWSGRSEPGAVSLAVRALGTDWQAQQSHGWWVAVAMTIAALAIMASHYRLRRWGVTIASALALVVTPLIVPASTDTTPAPPDLARLVSGRLGVVGIRPPDPSRVDPRRRSATPVSAPLLVRFTLPALPRDVAATVITRNTRLIGRATVAATTAWECCYSIGPSAVVVDARAPAPVIESRPAQGMAIDLASLDALRDTPISLRADAEIRFRRHRLAGELPLRAGSSTEVAGKQIEILGVGERPQLLLVRYTAFPTLARSGSALHLFVAEPQRTRIAHTTLGWPTAADFTGPWARRWKRANGRNWAGRFHVYVHNGTALRGDERLYVVESSDAGALRMPLAVDGLSLQPVDSGVVR